MTEFSDHQANGGHLEESQSIVSPVLSIFRQTAVAVEPIDRSLDDPALWQQLKTFGRLGTFDDLDVDLGQQLDYTIFELRVYE